MNQPLFKRTILLLIVIALTVLLVILYRLATAPDTQCTKAHPTTTSPPSSLTNAMDYFNQGNYDYDSGNCRLAITDYTKAIGLDPVYPQSYNNRAYTNMRLKNYAAALTDLDQALSLRPNYVEALMNRGDIYNYYYQQDRAKAIKDYDMVISEGSKVYRGTSVCGHRAMAVHHGNLFLTFIDILIRHTPGC